MPTIEVNGVNIAYEVAGRGPPLVWTGGGRHPRSASTYSFAGRFSINYKVLTWDRRNSGESDMRISDSPSEWHAYTDDLHLLLDHLEMSPAYIGGGSAGCMLSLLMAHRYPKDVKGLILADPPTDDIDILRPLSEGWYIALAEAAESGGMQEVIRRSSNPPNQERPRLPEWVSNCAGRDPDIRDAILSIDPKWFASIMRRWGKWFLTNGLHLVNLTDEEVKRIGMPAIIAPGRNDLHPERTARLLYNRLPNTTWVEYSDRLSEDEIRHITDEEFGHSTYISLLAPFIEDFLHRIESGTYVPDKK